MQLFCQTIMGSSHGGGTMKEKVMALTQRLTALNEQIEKDFERLYFGLLASADAQNNLSLASLAEDVLTLQLKWDQLSGGTPTEPGEKIASGLCPRCGKESPSPGSYCKVCNDSIIDEILPNPAGVGRIDL